MVIKKLFPWKIRHLFFKATKFAFSTKKNPENQRKLDEIKKNLEENNSIFDRIRGFLVKPKTQPSQKDIDKAIEYEVKNIVHLFSYVKTNISVLPSDISKLEKINELIDSISLKSKIKTNAKYEAFLTDILFIVNRVVTISEIKHMLKMGNLLSLYPLPDFYDNLCEKIKHLFKAMDFDECIEILSIYPKKDDKKCKEFYK